MTFSDPISDESRGFLRGIVNELDDNRKQTRAAAEVEARTLIEKNLGQLNADQISQLLELLNAGRKKGNRIVRDRFGQGLSGQNAQLVAEHTEALNPWVKKLWTSDHEQIPAVLDELWNKRIRGVGLTFPTAILYLRDPTRYAVWMNFLAEALRKILPSFAATNRTGANYLKYCAGVRELCDLAGCDPRLADLVLFKVSKREGPFRANGDVESGDPWDAFIGWAKRFYAHPDFNRLERDCKVDVAGQMDAVADAVTEKNGDWFPLLKKCFTHRKNGLTSWQAHDSFLKWCETNSAPARQALQTLWASSASPPASIRSFLAFVTTKDKALKGIGARTSIASFLQMRVDPLSYPPYRAEPFQRGYDLTGTSRPPQDADEGDVYDQAMKFLDRIVIEAEHRGLKLRDRLDAQGVLWCITKWEAPNDWPDELRDAFTKYREGKPTPRSPDPIVREIAELADQLLLDEDYLADIEHLLRDKRQAIFFGPPGTGKTFVARELAKFMAGDDGSVEIVQFHPSYAYEDFVEGYRPHLYENGQPGFRLVGGPLKRIAERARSNSDATHVLLIDEINRGNIAKVFGELYFLLEYRKERISLQYNHEEKFALPENLMIVGTMNTADRSIALMDAALRRRFYFVPFFPDVPPIRGLLGRWLQRHKPELYWLADAVNRANDRLENRHMAIGPSHFLRADLDDEWVERIWEHSILPYIAEQFYGEEDRVREYELAQLRKEAKAIADIQEMESNDDDDDVDAD